MKLLNERTKVRDVYARWLLQYPPDSCAKDTLEIGERLAALDPETATANDVTAIIGNDSWCGPTRCDECGQDAAVAVQLGEEPDYESRTIRVCSACLCKALGMLTPTPAHGPPDEGAVAHGEPQRV